jgi:hypothetical protein
MRRAKQHPMRMLRAWTLRWRRFEEFLAFDHQCRAIRFVGAHHSVRSDPFASVCGDGNSPSFPMFWWCSTVSTCASVGG